MSLFTKKPIGDADSLFESGHSFYMSNAGRASLDKAFEYLSAAAELGHPGAKFYLGCMYDNGDGVIENCGKARQLYAESAESGFAPAMFSLGMMYLDGAGVEESDEKAMLWFRKAADAGDVQAIAAIGAMYRNGAGVDKDAHKAVEYLQEAVDAGFSPAMYDREAGIRILRRAAEDGDESAIDYLRKVEVL
jgi:uncharacterized protein